MTALTTLGRSDLLAKLNDLEAENARLSDDYAGVLAERCAAQVRCDDLAAEHAVMLANLTHCQTRCTELLIETRSLRAKEPFHPDGPPYLALLSELDALRPLAPFAVALERGRRLHPEGANLNDLCEEVREYACEVYAVVVNEDRRREEATDVAVVAWRIAMGEGK